MIYDYIILGAGISGLTLLKKLRQNGHSNILGLEAENEAGGLCRTFYVDGHACDIGGHFFQTKYPEVEEFVFSAFPKEKCIKSIRVFPKLRWTAQILIIRWKLISGSYR